MSADNLVQAFPFRKMTGEVVWFVMEVGLSGLPYETVYNLSTKPYRRNFLEYAGPDAANKAAAAAMRWERTIQICEYGTEIFDADSPPRTMEDLRKEAVEHGYSEEDVAELREAPASQWTRLPVNTPFD
jgi:hypothetical protein